LPLIEKLNVPAPLGCFLNEAKENRASIPTSDERAKHPKRRRSHGRDRSNTVCWEVDPELIPSPAVLCGCLRLTAAQLDRG